MRFDALTRELMHRRSIPVADLPARDLFQQHHPSVTGALVTSTYGLLALYTRHAWIAPMRSAGLIGRLGAGCWLSPSALAACMVPYNLGLDSPREVCLLVDVSSVPELWGPGTCPPSGPYPSI